MGDSGSPNNVPFQLRSNDLYHHFIDTPMKLWTDSSHFSENPFILKVCEEKTILFNLVISLLKINFRCQYNLFYCGVIHEMLVKYALRCVKAGRTT
jgi:hypothetical protein